MNRFRRRETSRLGWRAFLVWSVVFSTLVACDSRPKGGVHVGYIPSASAAAGFLAIESDCLADRAVETHRYSDSNLLASDLKKGQVDIAIVVGLSQLLSAATDPADSPRLVAVYPSTPCFLVPKGAPEDGKLVAALSSGEKRIGSFPGTTFPLYTRMVLEGLGVDVAKVRISPIRAELQVSQLRDREIDALLTLEPVGADAVAANAGEYRYRGVNLLAKYVSQGRYFPGGAAAASPQFLDTKFLRRLQACIEKEGQQARSGSPEVVAALAKYASLIPDRAATFPLEAPAVGAEIRSDEMRRLISVLQGLGELPPTFRLEQVPIVQ